MDRLLDLTYQAEARHFWFQGFRQFVAPVLADVAGGRRDLRLLDCGCGTGANLNLLVPYGHAVGIDMSPGGLIRANQAGRSVARADVTRMPLSAGSFDVVTSFDVLQCVSDDVGAVREMARVARADARLVVTVAALDVLSGDHGEVWREVRRYTPARVRALMEQAGLRVERVSFLFASLFPLMLGARLAQRWSRPFRHVRDDSDISVPPGPVNAALATVLRAEAAVSRRVPMPIGSSLLIVATKSGNR
jgi:ubiquinone/menaquinone biosynthesis C-methylase UbiE